MNILITNDDGFDAEGLLTLADFAANIGEVTVVAPKVEQSGKSHGIELHRHFEVRRVSLLPGIEWYYVDSTPADCVRFAVDGLERKYDLVLSGINRGFNVGLDIVYSGTCGAIFEAAAYGINAIAFSTDPASFSAAAAGLDDVFEFIRDNRLLDVSGLYNINIPLDVRGTRITRQGGPYFKDKFAHHGDGMYSAKGYTVYADTADLSLDLDAVMNGYVSITPLSLNRTDDTAYGNLIKLNRN